MDLYHILLSIYLLIFLALSIKNLKWAVYLVILGLPTYLLRFSIGWLPMTVLEGMILIVFLGWLVRLARGEVKVEILKFKPLLILIGLFLIAASISVFVSPELRAAAGIWRAYFIEPILFLIVLVSIIRKEDFKYIIYTLSISILVLSIVAVYQKITGNLIGNEFWAAEATRRVTGVFEYPNALGLYLGPGVVLVLGWLMDKKKWYELGWLGLAVIGGILSIYFTGSKGAMLGILAAIIFYSIFYIGKRKYFIGILILGVLMGGYLIGTQRLDLKGVGTVEGGDSVTTRIEMWGEAWEMLKNRPILGAGLSGYQPAVAPYHEKEYIEIYLYPHNVVLNFWSEMGLLGLVAFLGIMIWFYITGLKIKDKLSVILMSSMIVILVHGLVDVPYFKNDLAVLWWVLIGGMVILKFRESEENRV